MRRLAVISSVLLPQPPKLLSPSVGHLALSGVAPIIRLPINPGSASLSLSGVVPTLGVSPGFAPSAGVLTLTPTTPVLSIASGLSLTPSVGSLTLSPATPVTSFGLTLSPTVASLTATGVAPTVTVATPFLPSQLGNLVGWYDASDGATITDDGSGKASQWNDKSANANNFAQATSGSRPTITASGINSLDVLTFAGSQKLINAACTGLPDNSAGVVIACVAQLASNPPGAFGYFYYIGTVGSEEIAFGVDTNWFEVVNNGGLASWDAIAALGTAANTLSGFLGTSSSGVFLNGTVGSGGGGGYGHNYTGQTSATIGQGVSGKIGEIVIASGISSTDREKLEGYLAWKWGLQGSLPGGHPYKSAAP